MKIGRILPQEFYNKSSLIIAKKLLGKVIERKTPEGRIQGIIVETESYGGRNDPASHASRKKTPRNQIMFGPPGFAYVYFCYGNHYLFNVVTDKEGIPSAVLIRAVEPVSGIDIMIKYYGKEIPAITSGPARFTKAFGIDKSFNGKPLFKGELVIRDTDFRDFKIVRAPRIGIKEGTDKLWRFYIKGNKFVSVK